MTLKSPIAMNLSEPIHFAILMMGIWRIFHITLIFLWFCLPDNPQSPPFHTSKVVSWTVDCRLKSQNLAKFYNIAKNMLSFWEFKHNFAHGVLQIKFITPFYSSRRNFWCMTRGFSWKKKFISRREIEDSQEDRTRGKSYVKNPSYTLHKYGKMNRFWEIHCNWWLKGSNGRVWRVWYSVPYIK